MSNIKLIALNDLEEVGFTCNCGVTIFVPLVVDPQEPRTIEPAFTCPCCKAEGNLADGVAALRSLREFHKHAQAFLSHKSPIKELNTHARRVELRLARTEEGR